MVPSHVRNQASSVSLHCITAWLRSPCIQVLYGISIGGQPIAVKLKKNATVQLILIICSVIQHIFEKDYTYKFTRIILILVS